MIPKFPVSFLVVLTWAMVQAAPALNGPRDVSQRSIQVLSTDPTEVLAVHNHYRALHGSPPLAWDDGLAAYALRWSKQCILEHSGGPYGENIAKGPGTWEQAITAWYNEQAQYDYANPGYTEATGHFSQLIWKSTSTVGCGEVYCPNLGGNYYTCEYYPRGNVLSSTSDTGKYFAQNVLH